MKWIDELKARRLEELKARRIDELAKKLASTRRVSTHNTSTHNTSTHNVRQAPQKPPQAAPTKLPHPIPLHLSHPELSKFADEPGKVGEPLGFFNKKPLIFTWAPPDWTCPYCRTGYSSVIPFRFCPKCGRAKKLQKAIH